MLLKKIVVSFHVSNFLPIATRKMKICMLCHLPWGCVILKHHKDNVNRLTTNKGIQFL